MMARRNLLTCNLFSNKSLHILTHCNNKHIMSAAFLLLVQKVFIHISHECIHVWCSYLRRRALIMFEFEKLRICYLNVTEWCTAFRCFNTAACVYCNVFTLRRVYCNACDDCALWFLYTGVTVHSSDYSAVAVHCGHCSDCPLRWLYTEVTTLRWLFTAMTLDCGDCSLMRLYTGVTVHCGDCLVMRLYIAVTVHCSGCTLR